MEIWDWDKTSDDKVKQKSGGCLSRECTLAHIFFLRFSIPTAVRIDLSSMDQYGVLAASGVLQKTRNRWSAEEGQVRECEGVGVSVRVWVCEGCITVWMYLKVWKCIHLYNRGCDECILKDEE